MADTAPRLLIINCASPYFFYIPMGVFGLCDYLGQRGVQTRIFSPSLYPEKGMRERLLALLDEMQPTHVGLACHWQETAHGLVDALAVVRQWSGEVVTIGGGFTAAFFGEDLLQTLDGLDYVVTGDAELPLWQLLQGRDPLSIANLIHRQAGQVVRNAQIWLIDPPTLEGVCFTDLSPLIDAERYLAKINGKLGFPLMLGRGCVFDCAYCGGSRHAFRLHSGRQQPVVRPLTAVLADLHRLKAQTRILYLCYENDQAFIKELFAAIAEDAELRGHFTLHYGAWHLLDEEFLGLYRRAFDGSTVVPIFEFSPEVLDDGNRQAIKRGATYSLGELERNCAAISEAFGGRVRIEVFFSRYHPALGAEDLQRELGQLLGLKLRLLQANLPVHCCFDHLSTDVASRYWLEHQSEPHSFSRFLALKQQVDEGRLYPFPVDNLCLFIPEQLDSAWLTGFEALIFLVQQMERICHELLYLLTAWYGERWLTPLHRVATRLHDRSPQDFFSDPPLALVFAHLEPELATLPLPPPPFLADLFRFSRTKQQQGQGKHSLGPVGTSFEGAFILDRQRVGIHEQDYADLHPLLCRISEHQRDQLAYQRTACLFCLGGILSLTHATYRRLLAPFEQPRPLVPYLAGLDARQQELLQHLVEQRILVPAATACTTSNL